MWHPNLGKPAAAAIGTGRRRGSGAEDGMDLARCIVLSKELRENFRERHAAGVVQSDFPVSKLCERDGERRLWCARNAGRARSGPFQDAFGKWFRKNCRENDGRVRVRDTFGVHEMADGSHEMADFKQAVG